MKLKNYVIASIVTAGLSVAATGVASANTSTTPTANDNSASLFKALDVNHDGKLTAAEMTKLPALVRQRHFDKLDSNGDGKIEQNEYDAIFIKHAKRMFANMDENKDGVLSSNELTWPWHHKAHKERTSKSGHGEHRRSHWHHRRHAHRHHRHWGTDFIFARMDKNQDGYVSAKEWQQTVQKWRDHKRCHHHGHDS